MIATLFYTIRKVGKELDTEQALMNRSKGQDFILTNELLKLWLQWKGSDAAPWWMDVSKVRPLGSSLAETAPKNTAHVPFVISLGAFMGT